MEETDLISELPDCLLHHIFYFVGMVYAVQTCVLSKRWRYLWTSMPYLYFPASVKIVEHRGRRDFVKFVDKVMSVRNRSGTRIHTTRICKSSYFNRISSDVLENWLHILVQHSVVVLDIAMLPEKLINLPHSLFNCQSLEKLSLCLDHHILDSSPWNFIKLPIGTVHLPVLRTLRLENLIFVTEDINNLISRCSALETLVISTCKLFGHNNLIVDAPQLKRLEILNLIREDVILTIITPNLTALYIKCKQVSKMGSFSLLNMASPMIEAEIDLLNLFYGIPSIIGCEMDSLNRRNGIDSIKYLPNVRKCVAEISKADALSLKLHGLLFQAIFDPLAQGCYLDTLFFEVRILKLTTFAERQSPARSCILKMCPNLETLVLNTIESQGAVDEEFIEMRLPPECVSHHLKFVEIRGDTSCLENEFSFVKFLLMNALVLETLSFQHECYVDLDDSTPKILKFVKEVKAIARASPNVKISLFSGVFCV